MDIRLSLDTVPVAEIKAEISCHTCSSIIMKSHGLVVSKIRAKVLIIKANQVFAVCKGCNSEVLVPLQRNNDLIDHFGPHLFLKK